MLGPKSAGGKDEPKDEPGLEQRADLLPLNQSANHNGDAQQGGDPQGDQIEHELQSILFRGHCCSLRGGVGLYSHGPTGPLQYSTSWPTRRRSVCGLNRG